MRTHTESLHAAENAALNRLLREALAAAGRPVAGLESAASDPLQILDLACGSCREAGTLVEVFREVQGGDRAIRLVGADLREAEIGEAAARARALQNGRDQFEFLSGNCADIGRHRELGRDFDVTFLRHQNFWNDPAVWQRIFANGLDKLRSDGLLVITSYFDREHELALEALQRAGGELVVTRRNSQSRRLDTPGKSVDRHVAVFRRPS